MPDRLDDLLRAARTDVLADIKGPDLVRVGARARTLRRRRRGTIAGAFTVVAALSVGALLNTGRPQSLPDPATTSTPTPSPSRIVYQGGGLTLLGLTAEGGEDVPGDIHDVQFVDADHGYVLAYDCAQDTPCPAAFAVTTDGGLTWRQRALPRAVTPQDMPRLVPLGPTSILLTGATPYLSTNFGGTWTPVPAAASPPSATSVPGGILTVDLDRPGTDCTGGEVRALQPDGSAVRLRNQPPITVCWVAASETGDGGWWVGGRDGEGRPALAVTRNDGRSWTRTSLTADAPEGAWAKATVVGSEVYAVVVTGDPRSADTRRGYEAGALTMVAMYRSGDRGRTFAPHGDGAPVPLVGDLVAMLDGRLAVVAPKGAVDPLPKFTVSRVDGTGFAVAPAPLPQVSVVRRTAVGWVAYNLFGGGWAAHSADGQTWRKITIY